MRKKKENVKNDVGLVNQLPNYIYDMMILCLVHMKKKIPKRKIFHFLCRIIDLVCYINEETIEAIENLKFKKKKQNGKVEKTKANKLSLTKWENI